MGPRIAAFLLAFAGGAAQAAQCSAQSGPATGALVELYTSEGCSSCPSAERWLSTLAARAAAGWIVPLALYVDYSDYLGWNGPHARRVLRQRKLSALQRSALVYTPQVLLQGRELRQWGGPAFEDAVARINAQPARAHLRLEILGADKTTLEVEARASLAAPAQDAALFMAAYRNGVESQAGKSVVLEWEGPFAVPRELTQRRRLPLLPGAHAADSGVAAFVQDRGTGEVLQALLRFAC